MDLPLHLSNREVGYTVGMALPWAEPVCPGEQSCLDSELLITFQEPLQVLELHTRWETGFHHRPVIKGRCQCCVLITWNISYPWSSVNLKM